MAVQNTTLLTLKFMVVCFRGGSGLYLIKLLRILYKARNAVSYRGHGMLNVLRRISKTCSYVCTLSTLQAPEALKLIQSH
jgi:hypothetical protein